MPDIKLQHVVSCSSEDKKYPAENLLLGDGFKKWKGAKTEEKQISVTFQLEKAVQIDKVDIGNDGSAFVEVLVNKSASGDEFQVLLVASSFMSPLDSRAGKNMTTVRMFGADKLSKNIAEEKWDRVKVVCTQPFNKIMQYGLAFIKLYSPPEEGATSTSSTTKTEMALGGFKLKTDEGDKIKTGSLFTSRDKEKVTPSPLSGAAAVRAASKLAEEAQKSVKSSTPRDTTQVKRKHDDDVPTTSKRKSIDSRADSHKSMESQSDSYHTPIRKQHSSTSSRSSSICDRDKASSLKKTKSEPTKIEKDVTFGAIMKNVVFVMSGYKNPDRATYRDKAQDMGADYKPDWGQSCTHLICAFENTPKYGQVKGKGRIVGRKWITDSYKAKKLMPWRSYRIGRARSPPGGSDSSDDHDDTPHSSQTPTKPKAEPTPTKTKSPAKEDIDLYGGDTDSGDDTEDEIRRVRESEKSSSKQTPEKTEADDIYDASTDEEMENGTSNGVHDLPELPDIFQGKKFFFYGSFDQPQRRKMLRFVVAYNGSVAEYMTEAVSYVLTKSSWDDNFDKALSDNPSIAFIRPDWLDVCDQQQKYVPYQKFSVIPN